MDIIITVPAKIKWDNYKDELEAVKDENETKVLNFKVSNIPVNCKIGDKCWVTHKGFVKGWMRITGFAKDNFVCEITGISWKGKFVQRAGKFHYISDKIPMKGFQGFKYYNHKVK